MPYVIEQQLIDHILTLSILFTPFTTASQMKNLKDLRIAPSSKHEILQTWGKEHHDSVTSRLAAGPMVMHGADNRSTWREGLGVDHEEWLKQKAAKEAARY